MQSVWNIVQCMNENLISNNSSESLMSQSRHIYTENPEFPVLGMCQRSVDQNVVVVECGLQTVVGSCSKIKLNVVHLCDPI